jgi:cyclic pyranopterin phosphate synthase
MKLTHINEEGNPKIVNISDKKMTKRVAVAMGEIVVSPATKKLILEGKTKKGAVLQTAIVGGIMGGKRSWEIIPMCHPIPIDGIEIEIEEIESGFRVVAGAVTTWKTGIEMEAITAVSTTLLTIYDMAKGVERGMEIGNIQLLYKGGGRTGVYIREGWEKVVEKMLHKM